VVQDMINEVMWGSHPLGKRIVGTEKSVRGISRKDITEYHRRMYVTGNCVVSVAGTVSHEEVVAQVLKDSRNMVRGGRTRFVGVSDLQRRPGVLVRQKETEQTHFCLGMRTFHREHPDRFGLKLMSTLLGENMSSRLFREVREKRGLAYSISTGVDRYLDTGAFIVSAGVVVDRAKEAVGTVLRELKRLKIKEVPKAELNRTRGYVVGLLKMAMDRTMSQMLWAGENLLLSGKLLSPEEHIRNLRAVTPKDIQRIANRIFLEKKLNLAMIGPRPEEKGAVKWLKL
jgi:predicted Zn-dependent peptidase